MGRGGAAGRCRHLVAIDLNLMPCEDSMTRDSVVEPSAPEKSTANFLSIQALRAVAALLVVLYHAFELWGLRVDPAAPGVKWTNGAAGVDIFFAISGFVMVISSRRLVEKPDAWLVFLWHRVIRIVPLYWLLTTLKILGVVLLPGIVLRTSHDFYSVAASYLFLPVVDTAGHFRPVLPVGWTLTYEFLFYLFFAAALAIRIDVLRILVPGLGLIAAVALFRTETWPDWTILFNTIVLEFVFGVVLAQWTLRGFRLAPAFATALVLGGFVTILVLPMGPENLRLLSWGLPAFAIVAGAVSLEPLVAPALPRWLLALGDASYSIYLSHGFVLPALMLLIDRFVSPGLSAQAITIILCLVVSSIAGWVVYLVVENPTLQFLRRYAGR
jgi:peptidoglycan/LPS O-acetylase OafA/YrhL